MWMFKGDRFIALSQMFPKLGEFIGSLVYDDNMRRWSNGQVFSMAMVPTHILTKDATPYLDYCDRVWKDMAADKEWNRYHNWEEDRVPTRDETILMGRGHNIVCSSYDGHSSVGRFATDLSNGDRILWFGFVWHNK